MTKINWEYWQNLALVMAVITLPMPKYNLNTQAIILMIMVWLFSGDLFNKLKRIKIKKYQFLSISIWLFMFVIGLLYSDNLEIGFKNIIKAMPLLVIPLVCFSEDMSVKKVEYLLKWFCTSVICCALFSLTKATYFTYMNFGNYFYNYNLATLLNAHTTYYSLFCVGAILFFLYQILFNKNKIIYWLWMFFLLAFLYLLSSRMSVFSLGAGTFTLLYIKFGVRSLFSVLPISLVIVGALFSPNFQKREIGNSQFGTTTPTISSRILHWKAVVNAVKSDNVIIGGGSGTNKTHVYKSYEEYGFRKGAFHKYNAHNQFLEHFIYFGLMAFLVWSFCFWIWSKSLFKNQHPMLFSLMVVTICSMLTESILERQRGIVFFALFISLALSMKTKENEVYD
ncbi:MAG: O-antigen ligase family protein [Psychroserpens sp.]|uniref:O-antigen ligase family protein n=1 Tax=Psychroserpens sp. TaxID=2020870 RepID=UPI003C77BA97